MSEIQEPHWRDLPDGADSDERADGTDERADGTDERADGTDEQADGTDEQADGTDERADGTDERADGTEPARDKDAVLEAFWQEARTRARFDWIGAYGGPTVLGSLRPPAWSFGPTPEEADAFIDDLLTESAIATAGALSDYEAEGVPQPEVGGVSIVLDGAGFPRALVATSAVSVVPLAELENEDVAVPVEGEDLTPQTQFVLERLTLLYPTKRHR